MTGRHRFFAALRMTEGPAQNDKRGAQNDKTGDFSTTLEMTEGESYFLLSIIFASG